MVQVDGASSDQAESEETGSIGAKLRVREVVKKRGNESETNFTANRKGVEYIRGWYVPNKLEKANRLVLTRVETGQN